MHFRFLITFLFLAFFSTCKATEYDIPTSIRYACSRENTSSEIVYYFKAPDLNQNYPILILCGGSSSKGAIHTEFFMFDYFQEWLEEVSSYRSTIIVGFNEQDGNQIFDSVAVVEKGKLLGIQRKHYLYHSYFTPGSSFSIFESHGIRFGVTICLDTNYFEPARLLAWQGATILFSPMCNRVSLNHPYAKRPNYYSHFVARSFENRCWLVTADWICLNDGSTVCPGHSVIYDPDGQEVARSPEGEEALLIVDIPKDRLFQEKGRRVHGSPILLQEISKLSMNGNTLCVAVDKGIQLC